MRVTDGEIGGTGEIGEINQAIEDINLKLPPPVAGFGKDWVWVLLLPICLEDILKTSQQTVTDRVAGDENVKPTASTLIPTRDMVEVPTVDRRHRHQAQVLDLRRKLQLDTVTLKDEVDGDFLGENALNISSEMWGENCCL